MKKITIIITLFLSFSVLFTTFAVAQDSEKVTPEPTFDFEGSIDTYFRASFSEDPVAPATSFSNLNGFALGMANFIVAYKGEKSGFIADIVFGPRGSDAVFGSKGNSSEMLNQLYLYYNITNKIKITMGNFNTFLGYEVISP